ncbi:MAG: (Fe-S)-binding protein [Saprospiraceae bacterium]|nr:(Fe-S)-binding protein [Saprospiraceae bacterium]
MSVASRLYGRVLRNIRLGKEEKIEGDEEMRWKNVLLVAFGQQKMFQRIIPAFLHLFIYLAFLVTQIELLEILIDGIFGYHRVFAPYLGFFYPIIISLIEILSILALVGTIAFLWRRNVKKLHRFAKPEMKGWPTLDANIILFAEIVLIVAIFTMNSSDTMLQALDPVHYPDTGVFALSGQVAPFFMDGWDKNLLIFLERAGWWLHVLVVFGFLLYLPISKHLHILLAFPNTYFARMAPKGKMQNMPEIMQEVKGMLGLSETSVTANYDELPEFGAKDVFDLSWKNILDAYSCTECGRCTAVCPANLTGKKLSPRKIMMDVRDRADEIGQNIETGHRKYIQPEKLPNATKVNAGNYQDDKSLFDYIKPEELHACTTCNACVEACPVLINPLDVILQMRRYEILTQSAGPSDWIPMFTSLENSGSVWQMSEDRDAWTEELTDIS